MKDITARYEPEAGAALGNLHHRSETLEGVGDLRFLLNARLKPGLFEFDFLRLGAGLSLPTGRIEENPYALPLTKHQHVQFGTGTVDPLLRADYMVSWGDLSLGLGAGLRAPLYENREDFQAPTEVVASAGPSWRASDGLSLSLRWTALYQTRGTWDGEPDPNLGYFQHGLSLSAGLRLSKDVYLIPQLIRTIGIDTRGDSDAFEMDWLAGLTLEVGFGAPQAPPASEASPP